MRFQKIKKGCFILFFLCSNMLLIAQDNNYDSLNALNGYKAKVYYSEGVSQRAQQIASRINRVMAYYKTSLGLEPTVNILILNQTDWPKYYAKGAVYGMPHYTGTQTLVVASEDNRFWQSQVPPVKSLPPALAEQLVKTYTSKDGKLTMQGFFDLLAIHELGHAYHNQAKVKMQRRWMGEFFPNVLLHTYIAENEPDLLPALTLFPEVVIAGGSNGFTYTTLADFETHYNDIATKSPRNYGWYQCKLHAAAATLYDKAGKNIPLKLWEMLKAQDHILSDEELYAALLKVHPALADVLTKW